MLPQPDLTPHLDKKTALAALNGFAAFEAANPPKQARYKHFLQYKAQHVPYPPDYPTTWTAEEVQYEYGEFVQAARIFQPMSVDMASRFTRDSSATTVNDNTTPTVPRVRLDARTEAALKNLYGPLTRSIGDWKPDRLLCKRFNVG
jgi:G patch domain-containing protein 1